MRVRLKKTSFSAGELRPELRERGDLKVYGEALAKARNVAISPLGWIYRRPGTRWVAAVAGDGRLLPFSFNTEQEYLFWLGAAAVNIFANDVLESVVFSGVDPTPIPGSWGVTIHPGLTGLQIVRTGNAFNGSNAENKENSAYVAAPNVFALGRRLQQGVGGATPSLIDSVLLYPSIDEGFIDGDGPVDIWVYGKEASPAPISATDGVLIGHKQLAADQISNTLIQSTNKTTRFEYVWVVIGNGSGAAVAEIEIRRIVEASIPWTLAQLSEIGYTQSADTMLIVHPEWAPRKITRYSAANWSIAAWSHPTDTSTETLTGGGTLTRNRITQPYYKFADASVTVTPSAGTGNITLTASANLFNAAHVGQEWRIGGRAVTITAVSTPTSASATVKETLKATTATEDHKEPAWSSLRGWPATVTFHQDRTVVGGSRDLPNRVWMSRSSDLFNFEPGVDADNAIDVPLMGDQVNAIRAVVAGRQLEIYTSGTEWAIANDVLTPTDITASAQTSTGSLAARRVRPVKADGATLYPARVSGRLYHWVYQDVEAAYVGDEMSLLAQHLLPDVRDLAYDLRNRWLLVPTTDGKMAVMTLYRAEQKRGWTRWDVGGDIRAVAALDAAVYVLVLRGSAYAIEKFDPDLYVDFAASQTASPAKTSWTGLGYLDGLAVRLRYDGAETTVTVASGTVTTPVAASAIQVGLPFTHEIEPLPPFIPEGQDAQLALRWRPIRATFSLTGTAALAVDWKGAGAASPVPLAGLGQTAAGQSVVGRVEVALRGWRKDIALPVWAIKQDAAQPFALTAVEVEVDLNA